MEYSFLSLAMTETKPGTGDFNVIAMDMHSYKLIPIKLSKNEIITPGGQVIWDVGRITVVDRVQRYVNYETDPRNVVYVASNCRLSEEGVNLKRILEENISSADVFYSSPSGRFAIVKVNDVSQLLVERRSIEAMPQCKMTVSISGSKRAYKTLLNKDYRWVNYWLWKYDQENNGGLEADYNRYVQILNRRGKTLYLILYRHYFRQDNRIWIAGMHWL